MIAQRSSHGAGRAIKRRMRSQWQASRLRAGGCRLSNERSLLYIGYQSEVGGWIAGVNCIADFS
jgi:hypothetical protein